MLKKLAHIAICLTLGLAWWMAGPSPQANADCSASPGDDSRYGDGSVDVSCEVETTTPGEPDAPADGSEESGSTDDAPTCHDTSGAEIACWANGYAWYDSLAAYCRAIDTSPDDPNWEGHRDDEGHPVGAILECVQSSHEHSITFEVWVDTPPDTPAIPGVDPETVVRTAVDSLGLHAPTVGVGAYVYPDAHDWGLSWWVGAPMWLWIDATDPLQWGSHTLDATDSGLSISATITATQVTFNTGDGTAPTTCLTPGTPRPWNPDDLLSRHSPSTCEHTYMHTNTLGDKTSRFTVSANVTWLVEWSSTDSQHGSFTITTGSVDNPAIHIGEIHSILVPNPQP